MSSPERDQQQDAQLKAAAEARLARLPLPQGSARTLEDALHELQVHQIELEMQNEALRQAQNALEESRDRFVDFYEFAPVGYLTLTDKGLIGDINLTGAALLGAERKNILQRRFSSLVMPGDVNRWRLHFVATLNDDKAQNCELALQREDGSQVQVRLDSLRLLKDGQTPALRIVVTDITERKQAETLLADSEERFRLFMDTLPTAAFMKDESSTTIYANRYMEEVLGAREWLGKTATDLFPPEIAEKMIADDQRALAGESVVTEERVPGTDGTLRTYQTYKFGIPQQGRRPLLGGVALDMTRIKETEQQLVSLAAGLERAVIDRTKRLRTVSAQLGRTEERERRLLAEELHDNLIQLIFTIKIKLSLLAPGSPQSEINHIAELADQAERAGRLTMQQLSPPALHLLGLVPALEWLAEEMERTHKLVVHFHSEGAPEPLFDETKATLFRSVRELLSNVVKHAMPCEASLSCVFVDSELLLVVSDDGCGFDPASRPDELSSSPRFGLTSINERMINMGGKMEIDSCPGNGTMITLTVPCSAAAERRRPS